MDRSWYNRAGVERVLGYCTNQQCVLFLDQVPLVERMLVDDGIILIKLWFSVSDTEQEKRLRARLHDPMRRWKLSDTDVLSITKWEDYSRAKDEMFEATDLPETPWWTIESDDKRASRINAIHHILEQLPYTYLLPEKITIPDRPKAIELDRPPRESNKYVHDHAATLSKK